MVSPIRNVPWNTGVRGSWSTSVWHSAGVSGDGGVLAGGQGVVVSGSDVVVPGENSKEADTLRWTSEDHSNGLIMVIAMHVKEKG